MANLESLESLLTEELKDIYDAEKQLTKALPKMVKKASAPELKQAFGQHLRQTEAHVGRLDQVFAALDLPAKGKKCEGMQHLISEGEDMIGDIEDDATRDALMVAAAQKVEHYEIASYGTLRTWANLLGKRNVASLLERTLDEEKDADRRLTSIAEGYINKAAAEGGDEQGWETGRRRRMRHVAADRAARSKRSALARSRSRR